MNLQAFKDLLQMTESQWENRLDEVLRENFTDEAKEMLLNEIIDEVNVEQEVVEAILEHVGIDYQ
jgi:hypothetical protein